MAVATESTHNRTADWDELRALHVKGVTLKELSDRYGISYNALRSRSSREKWCNTVSVARQFVAQSATDALAQSAAQWIGKIDRAVHAGIDNVLTKGLDKLNLRDLQTALDCAERANRIARLNYGLDKDASGARVTVNVAVDAKEAMRNVSMIDAVDIETVRVQDVETSRETGRD